MALGKTRYERAGRCGHFHSVSSLPPISLQCVLDLQVALITTTGRQPEVVVISRPFIVPRSVTFTNFLQCVLDLQFALIFTPSEGVTLANVSHGALTLQVARMFTIAQGATHAKFVLVYVVACRCGHLHRVKGRHSRHFFHRVCWVCQVR